ncbi:FG-GAP repeat domain-containing protein [Verrucomicrobiota bacterium]
MKSLLSTKIGASLVRCLAITIIALPAFCIPNIHADTYAGGDFDGDRRADPVQVTDDNWFIWLSSFQYQIQQLYDFSLEGGTFLSADFDGDTVADVAMVDGSCNWYICFSSESYQVQGPYNLLCSSGIPLAADMDGDGKADPAMVVGGNWYIWSSSGGYQIQGPYDFSVSGGYPVAGDIDGDGKADPAMVCDGDWSVWYSSANYQKVGPVELGISGTPVLSDFDGDDKADPAMVDDNDLWYFWLSGSSYQQQGPYALSLPSQDPQVVAVVMHEGTNETYAVASVFDDYMLYTNCTVSVNNTPLTYGFPILFTNDNGLIVSLTLPVYYADLLSVNTGDTVAVTAYNDSQELLFQSEQVTIPEQVTVLNPTNNQVLSSAQDVDLSWTSVAGAQGYLVSYLSDVDSNSDDNAGIYVNFMESTSTNVLISSTNLLAGTGTFTVGALAGSTNIFDSDYVSGSFFIAGTGDSTETTITNIPTLNGTVGLQLVKSYRKTIEGIRFTIREYNPAQIQYPGTITVQVKLRKRHLAVAFIQAYDMNGNAYFSWKKVRKYKSKNKRYRINISARPGTTIVIGTKTTKLEVTSYSY